MNNIITTQTINGKELSMEVEVEVVHNRTFIEDITHEVLSVTFIARGYDEHCKVKHDGIMHFKLKTTWEWNNDDKDERVWQCDGNVLTTFNNWYENNFSSLKKCDFNVTKFNKLIIKNFSCNLRMNENNRTWRGFIDSKGKLQFPDDQKIQIINFNSEQ